MTDVFSNVRVDIYSYTHVAHCDMSHRLKHIYELHLTAQNMSRLTIKKGIVYIVDFHITINHRLSAIKEK